MGWPSTGPPASTSRGIAGQPFYALGAYVGVSAVTAFTAAGGPPWLFIVPMAAAGLAVGLVGVVVERGLLRFVYDRDESFQLLLTFALVLMMEDLIRMTWGTEPGSGTLFERS